MYNISRSGLHLSKIKLFFLGSPHVEFEGKPIEFDTRKAVALFAFLTVTAESHHRDTLAVLLWPELNQVRARAALRRTLSTLRNAIPTNFLITGGDTVGVDSSIYWLDVAEFRELILACKSHGHLRDDFCQECVPQLETAAGLYRGDFLSGFTLRDSASFDDWQFFQSENLRGELAYALQKLCACLSADRDYETAITHARRWISIDPLHEEAHRQLMRLYAYSGRREASIRQFRECARILNEELGVHPLEETVNLYNEIKENRVALPEPAPSRKLPSLPVHGTKKLPEIEMEGQLRRRPLRAPLIGRNAQWSRLLDSYHSLTSDGHFVLIEGEAGIGKTHLAEEFLTHALDLGAAVVRARCYEGERNFSYGPIVEGLRAVINQATTLEWLDDFPVPWLSEVARILPELSELRPDLPPLPQPESPGAQNRFFEAIGRFLLALFQGPATGILFIDDLHWADNATLDLLNYLVRRMRGRPIFIVGTSRREELFPGSRLRQIIGEAQRNGNATLISLERFSQDEINHLVEAFSALDLPQSVRERLFLETEGLPFFVVEYLSELRESNQGTESREWSLPASVRDLLHSRLAEVTEAGSQLLTTAAVIGRSFGFDTLKEASGRGEEETITGLESLVAKGLIEEVHDSGDDSEPFYDFRHEKLRTLVYEETGSARRRLLHRRVAEALANRSRRQQSPNSLSGQIAYHYRLGGEKAEASKHFKLAGDFARSIHANTDALQHYRNALELGHPEKAAIYVAIGDIQTLLGEYSAAINNYTLAGADHSSNAEIEHKIGNVYQRQGDWEQADKHYLLALEALTDLETKGERARILADRSLVAYHSRESDMAKELALEALFHAEQAEDPYAESQAHNILGILARSMRDFDSAIRHLNQSLAIAEEYQALEMRVAALNNLALVFGTGKDLNRAIRLTEEALNLCNLLGDRHREAALHSNLADLLHKANQPDAAIGHLKKSVVLFAEIGDNAEDLNPEVWKLVDW